MTEAGWYPDPKGEHDLRWFDGVGWTTHGRAQGRTTAAGAGAVAATTASAEAVMVSGARSVADDEGSLVQADPGAISQFMAAKLTEAGATIHHQSSGQVSGTVPSSVDGSPESFALHLLPVDEGVRILGEGCGRGAAAAEWIVREATRAWAPPSMGPSAGHEAGGSGRFAEGPGPAPPRVALEPEVGPSDGAVAPPVGPATHEMDDLEVRSAASSSSEVVLRVERGTRCTLLELRGRWALVAVEGSVTGWVDANGLALITAGNLNLNLTSVVPALAVVEFSGGEPAGSALTGVLVDQAGAILERSGEPVLGRWRVRDAELFCAIAESGLGPLSLLADEYLAEFRVAAGTASLALTETRLVGAFDSGRSAYGDLAPGRRLVTFAWSFDDVDQVLFSQAKRFSKLIDAAAGVLGGGAGLICDEVAAVGSGTPGEGMAGLASQVTSLVVADRLSTATDPAERAALVAIERGHRVKSRVPFGVQWEAQLPSRP